MLPFVFMWHIFMDNYDSFFGINGEEQSLNAYIPSLTPTLISCAVCVSYLISFYYRFLSCKMKIVLFSFKQFDINTLMVLRCYLVYSLIMPLETLKKGISIMAVPILTGCTKKL